MPKGGWGDLFGNLKIHVWLEFMKGISVNRDIYSIMLWVLILCLPGLAWAAEEKQEFKFDLSEVEKKPYHLGGYGEFRPVSERS